MSLIYAPRLKFTTEVEETSVNNYPVLRYRHVLDGESDDVNDGPREILLDPLCPRRGDSDPVDATAYVDRVKVVRTVTDDARPFFLIHIDTRTDFQETTDPRTDPAEIEWYSQSYQNFSTKDRHDKTIFNTAGSIFKFAHDDAYWIARVSKNVTATPYDLFEYENAINDAEFQIDGVPVGKETVRCNGVRISAWRQATVNGNRVYYRTVTFMLIHRPQGWLIKKDNVGFEQYVIRTRPEMEEILVEAASTGVGPRAGLRQLQFRPLVDADGNVLYIDRGEREPIMLDNGQRPFTEQVLNREGLWVPDPRPEDVITIEIDHYKPMPFNNLPGVNDAPTPRGSGMLPLG